MVVHKRRSTAIRSKEIVTAARKLISEFGSDKLTIREIARQTGITQGAVYRHFRSKKDILLKVIDNTFKETSLELNQAFGKALKEGKPYLDAVNDAIRHLLLGIPKNIKGELFGELYRLEDPVLNAKIIDNARKRVNQYEKFLSKVVESGEMREDVNVHSIALLLFCIVHGLINTWGVGKDGTYIIEKTYDNMWNSFCNLIVKQ